jgi:uncharacterized repeat protein (TIGR03803 family)
MNKISVGPIAMKRSIRNVVALAALLLSGAFGHAQIYRAMHQFTGGTDGGSPSAGVILDTQGSMYSTTGATGSCGILFKVDSNGNQTILYSFPKDGSGGCGPQTGVVRDSAGNFYGTTAAGGVGNCSDGEGCGVVFKIDASGNETILHAFTGYPEDGELPMYVVLGRDGTIYGTTYTGGTHYWGTVFKIDTSGNETILHNFDLEDGAWPYGKLFLGPTGNLYGTTYRGGSYRNCDGLECGVVFKPDPEGNETVLYNFQGKADGGNPFAGVIEANGTFYGTTDTGGSFAKTCGYTFGCGTLFALKQGKLTVLHSFTGGGDGEVPHGGVIREPDGTFYGTTLEGGAEGFGTIYSINSAGVENILYSFCCWHGKFPAGGVVRDTAGRLYGTTIEGGSYKAGVVFRFTP